MKKVLAIIAFIIISLQMQAQTLDGNWKGTLQAGPQKLTLVLHISQADKQVTLDVVEQGANGIPMTVNCLSNDSVNVSVSQLALRYEGKVKDNEINGTFHQQTFSAPLIFKKGEVTYNRPQEPQPPYPYKTEEVTFENKNAGVTLCGTLTTPSTSSSEAGLKGDAVVLMITGSGPQNRDEELFHHKPFLIIADYLARHGIASLRYDDRGTAKSTGDFNTATTFDFAEDAQAGLDWLRKSGRFSKVGILGHSEGGLIAYMLQFQKAIRKASGNGSDVDFIVSLAGPACKIDTMLMVQLNGLAHAQGLNTDVVHNVSEARQLFLKEATPWTKAFIDIDATPYVKATTCPVLALGGDKDLNVPVSINVPSLEKNLPKNPDNIIKVYPGLSHLFQHSTTGSPTEAVNIEETISPEVLKDIADWILKL